MTHALAARKSTQITETKKLKPNGGRGIRTPERVTPLTVFKTAGFNHSPIPPSSILPDFIALELLSLLGFPLARQHCHWFVTTGRALHGPRLGFLVRMGVAHGHRYRRMPKQFL